MTTTAAARLEGTTTGARVGRAAPRRPRDPGPVLLAGFVAAALLVVEALARLDRLGVYSAAHVAPLAVGFAVLAYGVLRIAAGWDTRRVLLLLLGGFFIVGATLAHLATSGAQDAIMAIVVVTTLLVVVLRGAASADAS